MKKCFLFIFLLSTIVINAKISVEVVYNNKNESQSHCFVAMEEGTESEFLLLNKKFKISITSIRTASKDNKKVVEFDFFEIDKGTMTFLGSFAIGCFPLSLNEYAHISYGQKVGDEIQESISCFMKEIE